MEARSTESLSSIDGFDIEKDIIDFENAPDYVDMEYIQLLRDLQVRGNRGYPLLDRPPVNWKIIVELNYLLSKNSVSCWWYDEFLRTREEFMYVPEDQPNSTYKSGKKKGQRKVKSRKMLTEDYERLYTQAERTGIFQRKLKNADEMINKCVKRLVENKWDRGNLKLIPDLDGIRDFLEKNKGEINKALKKIPKGYRGVISYMDLHFNDEHMWYESLKFAHPLYTVLSLSDPALSLRGLYPWFRKTIGSYIPDIRGSYYKDGRGDSYIAVNSTLKDNIADNSLSICKVLLEYIDLDVLNHKCSLSAVTDIIKFATMKYPNTPIPTPNGNHNHTQHPREEERLNRTVDTAHKMFEMLVNVGLKNQSLMNTEFDVLGGSWTPRRVSSDGLGMDRRYMDPRDTRLASPYAKTLLDFCHPKMVEMWGDIPWTFDRRKLLNYAVGLEDPGSPLSYLDNDAADYVGIELSRQPIKYHREEPLRRNFFSQGERENKIKAFQRLNTARGLDSLTSHIGSRSGIDMGNIMDIMSKHGGIQLLEDAKYAENKMTPENYTEPRPPESYHQGDVIEWGDDNIGTVIADGRERVKVSNLRDGREHFIPKDIRGLGKIHEEGPTYSPGSPPGSEGGGSSKKYVKKKKNLTKKKKKKI